MASRQAVRVCRHVWDEWRGDFESAEINALHAEGFGHHLIDDD